MARFRIACVAVVVSSTVLVAPAAAGEPEFLRPPVEAPVAEAFSLPFGPYGPGNRGIEYDTEPGVPVRAAAGGTVVFAGPVAASLHLSIDHGGGLVSSYSYVERITVSEGSTVAAGEIVAVTGERLHFGVRRDGIYVDPAGLLGRRVVRVRLDPTDDDPWAGRYRATVERYDEIVRFLALTEGGGWSIGAIVAAARDAVVAGGAFVDEVSVTVAARLERMAELEVWVRTLSLARSVTHVVVATARAALPEKCTPASVAPGPRPPGRRIAIVVDGLDSSSDAPNPMDAVDLGAHGYDAADVVRFSYAGGVVPASVEPGTWAEGLTRHDYTRLDTHEAVATSATELADVIAAVAALNPGVPIDLYGHSLGGVVIQHGVIAARRVDPAVPVGTVVTIASPHRGAPAADLLVAADMTGLLGAVGDRVEVSGGIGRLLAVVGDPVIDDLSAGGWVVDHADDPFPDDIAVTTIGVRYDAVVPSSRTVAAGADHHTVVDAGIDPLAAHGEATGLSAVDREIGLALAGAPPTCRPTLTRVWDALSGSVVDEIETGAAGAVVLAQTVAVSHPVGLAVVGGAVVAGAVIEAAYD